MFERLDLLTDGRLGNVKLTGRLGKAAGLSHPVKRFQLIDIH